MSTMRVFFAVLCAAAGLAVAAGSGPALAKWQFTGKDKAGVVWKGTLTLSKWDPVARGADPDRAGKFYAVCNVEVENADGAGQGYDGPCTYDEGSRTLAFGDADTVVYSAVLSADGKTLKGKWTGKKDGKAAGSGAWEAKLTGN